VVTNSNLNSHRVRLNAGPDARLNFTLDYYHLWADVPLPTGQSTYGNNELDLVVRWPSRSNCSSWAWPASPGLAM